MRLSFTNKCLAFCMCSLVVFFCCFGSSSSFITKNIKVDRLALVEFKAKLIDPRRVMNSWNDTAYVCDWYGVTCSRRHHRVIMLNLQSSQLIGPISPSIGNLSFLRDLHLQNNSLNGELPYEISHLRRLRKLNLANNSIGGTIPSNLSRCSNLISLQLQYNHLVGKIPIELGFFSNLQVISLGFNNLTGTIPHSLGNLTFLSVLILIQNNLMGSIPDGFGKLNNFEYLVVDESQVSGVFPPSILNLSSISTLDLAANQFYGNLPSNLGTALPNLQFFSIGDNLFSGSIPHSITNATSLGQLYLDTNKFIGEVPSLERLNKLIRLSITDNSLGYGGNRDLRFISSLINATELQMLMINVNNFGGVLPESIGNLSSKLMMFHMDNNKISGHIPTGIENLVGLQDFRIWSNNLSGNIPENIGKLQNLQALTIRHNLFSGKIPISLGNLSRVNLLDLSENNLQGKIPETLGKCQQLIGLDLGRNNLSGQVPPQIFELSSLSIVLSLHDNQLSGSLPEEVENLKNVGILDVSRNMLSNEIPNNLGSCIKLEAIYMSENLFQGSIPPSLSSLRGLRILDLSRNNLSGEVPEYFASFQLQQLNLSYNDFEGMIPMEGVFKNANVVFVEGNNRLCGGIPELKLPICDFKVSKRMHRWRLIIIILCGAAGLVIFSLLVYVFWFRKKKKELASSCQTFLVNSLLDLTYHDLFKATSGFSSENLIGTGSFGSVFKGKIDEGRTTVAVKVLNLWRHGAIKSFTAECEALRNIRHRNLIKVLTACSSVDNHGNDFKALVYEFMANGSLEDWLHPPTEIDEGAPPRHLNFCQRLNIAIEVAFALDYLHHHCGATIVHCDLKPSNVLLDDEMIAHVGDFGVAKFLSQCTIDSATTQSSSIGVRGTIGYASPEYGMANEVSTYGDVYSFGILLLEIFTGKRPTDSMFKGSLNLHTYCKDATPERLIEILDPTIAEEVFEGKRRATRLQSRRAEGTNNNMRVMDGLNSLFVLATSCSFELPKDRPNITDVAAQLCAIRNQIL